MGSTIDFIEFVCEQVKDLGNIRYKKMFGEYMVYINNKPILLVCDNTVFVKQSVQIEELMKSADKDTPYSGSKEHYILDIEDKELTAKVVQILELIIPVPKPRKKSVKSKNVKGE